MIDPSATPDTFNETDVPPEVRAALYSRIHMAACGASLSDLFRSFPDVWHRLLLSQIVACGLYVDPWAPWIVDSLIDDIRRVQLATWAPPDLPN